MDFVLHQMLPDKFLHMARICKGAAQVRWDLDLDPGRRTYLDSLNPFLSLSVCLLPQAKDDDDDDDDDDGGSSAGPSGRSSRMSGADGEVGLSLPKGTRLSSYSSALSQFFIMTSFCT